MLVLWGCLPFVLGVIVNVNAFAECLFGWLLLVVLSLNDVDVGIVSQHHCCHYLSLRLLLLACTVGCHVYCWLLNCTSRSCSCCLHTYYWYRSLGMDILVVELL